MLGACPSPNVYGPPLPPIKHDRSCRRFEVGSYGIDENLQLVNSDGSMTNVGLRVPFLNTPNFQPTNGDGSPDTVSGHSGRDRRYLFMCSSYMVAPKQRIRLRGIRQLAGIGAFTSPGSSTSATSRATEYYQVTPQFKFIDGNIAWGVRWLDPRMRPGANATGAGVATANGTNPSGAGPFDTNNFSYRFSNGPALLYDINVGNALAASKTTFPAAHINPVTGKPDFYVFLNQYYPPTRGQFFGFGAAAGIGEFYELRYPYDDSSAWTSLGEGVDFEGPGLLCAMCSVRQTNPATRTAISPPATFFQTGIAPEEAFMLNFPSAVYWRVGMSLLIEDYGCC